MNPIKTTLAAILILACSASAFATEINGISFADHVTVGGKSLSLNGLGLRQATFLKVNVYAGALYVATPSHDAETILASSDPKRVEMTFMRGVGRDKIAEAWGEGFEKNCTEKCDAMKPGIAKLQSFTTDMNKGEIMAFDILPDHVDVWVAGRKAGTIDGADFSKNLLRLWIGKNPPNSGLKSGLLGIKD